MAARATVEIVASLRDAVTGPLNGIRRAITATFSGVRGLAAGALGAGFLVAAKNVALARDEMGRFAETTGQSVEDVSRLKFALDSIGKGDNLKELFNQLAGKTGDAVRSPGQARSAFAALGVDLRELGNLGAVDILKQLADGYALAGNRAQAAANLQAIFGDQFRELLPLLSQGSRGLNELAKRSDELGATITAQDALNAKEFAKNWREFEALASGLFGDLVDFLLPEVNSALREIREYLRQSGQQITDRNKLNQLSPLSSPAEKDFIAGIADQIRQAEKAATVVVQATRLPQGNGNTPNGLPDEGFWKGYQDQLKLVNDELSVMQTLGKQTALALNNAFSSNITSAIRAVRTGALSVKDALDSLLDGLIDDLAEFATSELVKRLVGAGLNFFFGAAGASGGGGGNTYGDIGTSPPPSLNSAGGGGLLGGGLGGFKRLGGGGGTTINVYGSQTREEQTATVAAIMRDQIGRNRQVRLDLRAV